MGTQGLEATGRPAIPAPEEPVQCTVRAATLLGRCIRRDVLCGWNGRMIIEQDKDQLLEAIYLHTRAEIRLIRLAESHLYSRARIDSIPATGLGFQIKFTPGAFTVEQESLTLNTDFSFAVTPENDSEHSIIRIECRFEGLYHLIPDYLPSPEQIEAFRSANAVFNTWP